MSVLLAYGHSPLVMADHCDEVLEPPQAPPAVPIAGACDTALHSPCGAQPVAGRFGPDARVLVVVSDATRDEPRAEMVAAVRRALSRVRDDRLTIAVANGTHLPGDPALLGLGDLLRRHPLVNHDPRDQAALVDLGTTARGTHVRLNRAVVEADLVIVTGRIKPHYFAGFGGGAKGVFPGLGTDADIRRNHLLKADPSSRLGRADGNACREDIEEAVSRVPAEVQILDVVCDGAGRTVAAVAGHPVAAHRAGAALCRPLCEVAASPADIVVVSEGLPVTLNLYQASKLLAPAGLLLRDGGVVVLVAECPAGTGPIQTVNEGIYRLGLRHYLPERHTVLLVSSLDAATVAGTYCTYAASVEEALAMARRVVGRADARIVVLPRAGELVPVRQD